MLRKHLFEATVWLVLILVLIGSIIMTYKVRYAIDTVNSKIEAGEQAAQCKILEIKTKKSWTIIGYAKVREDIRGYIGWTRPEVDGYGFYLVIED